MARSFSIVVRRAAGDVIDGALAVARSSGAFSIVVRRAAGDVVDGALMQWRAPLVPFLVPVLYNVS